jgi:hypothetical protein
MEDLDKLKSVIDTFREGMISLEDESIYPSTKHMSNMLEFKEIMSQRMDNFIDLISENDEANDMVMSAFIEWNERLFLRHAKPSLTSKGYYITESYFDELVEIFSLKFLEERILAQGKKGIDDVDCMCNAIDFLEDFLKAREGKGTIQ